MQNEKWKVQIVKLISYLWVRRENFAVPSAEELYACFRRGFLINPRWVG